MVKRSKGPLNGRTRMLKGKSVVSVARQVRTFELGDEVVISPMAQRAGMPHLRYANRNGIVIEKRGKSYVVEVFDYHKKKKVVVGPIHINPVK